MPRNTKPKKGKVLNKEMNEGLSANFWGLNLTDFINSIEQGVLIEDSKGKIIFANQKLLEMLSYSLSELVGKNWPAIVPKEEWRTVNQQLKIIAQGRKSQYETVILTKSGMRIPVIVGARPLGQLQQYQGAIFTFTDIVERKRAEQELESKSERLELLNRALNLQRKKLIELTEKLERANQELKRLSEAKSDFVAAVSHDLRTPLTTIIEGISLVEDGTLGGVNEEQKKFLRLAIEDAERLNDFISDILDLAKIEAGKIVPKKTMVKPKEQIERLKISYENLVREKGLELLTNLPDPEVCVFCDSGHYYRVLVNFLSNAIKFTPSGGKITIQVCRQPAGIILTSVQDTGIGIPLEQKHHIFRKFEQIEHRKSQKGSGLGLALCKQLVELNGGKIGFESEVNKGSNFYFSLPVYDEITDFNYILETINQKAKIISGHTIVFLFRVEGSAAEIETTLKKIYNAIQPKILTDDLLRTFNSRQAVVLVSALPEENAQPVFADLIEAVKNIGLNNITAGFYVCPVESTLSKDPNQEVLPDARTVLKILENKLQPIT